MSEVGDILQQRIEVKETNENVGRGNHNCLVVTIYENDEDELRKLWKSQLKKFKGKVSDKKEMFCDNASIKKFGDNILKPNSFSGDLQ